MNNALPSATPTSDVSLQWQLEAGRWQERLGFEEMSLQRVCALLEEARVIQEQAFPEVLATDDRQHINGQFHLMLRWLSQSRNMLRRHIWERGCCSDVDPDVAKPHIIFVVLVHIDTYIRRAAEVLWR